MKSPLPAFRSLLAALACAGLLTAVCAAEPQAGPSTTARTTTANIPGPLRSFLRMAAISQKVSPAEVLPLLSRNVVMLGYNGPADSSSRPTEYLTLLRRYIQQARELDALGGATGVVHVTNCEDAKPLLVVIGYRVRRTCGKDAALETADSERAFLTLDSGFPLAGLEEALRTSQPFDYTTQMSQVPVLFSGADWTGVAPNPKKDILDALVEDPSLARLYWAMARMDVETAAQLRESPGLRKLLRYGPVLDFYSSQLTIRDGRVVVPGGTRAEGVWKSLVGGDASSAGDFVLRLVSKDEGWLAAYFDALARTSKSQQAYFTDPHRLARFYTALRGRNASPGAARPTLRPAPGLLLLMYRLRFDPDGRPSAPGSLEVWQEGVLRHSDYSLVRDWARHTTQWKDPDDLVEAMVALSRLDADDSPIHVFLTLNEIDRRRAPAQRLSAESVRLLADRFSRFGSQYTVFAEFYQLDNASIARYLNTAATLDRIADPELRANALGTFQAVVALWEVLARQGQISAAQVNDSWQRIIHPFSGIRTSAQTFDAGRNALREILQSAAGKPSLPQDEVVSLLAGPDVAEAEGRQAHAELTNRMQTVLQNQRLVPLDTLFALSDGLRPMAQGASPSAAVLSLAGELSEFELPRSLFTNAERSEWSAGHQSSTAHAVQQAKTDFVKLVKAARTEAQVAEIRGRLAAYLRDALVGLAYAYYEPPGAQMLHNNPLFVRAHDFSGMTTVKKEASWQTPHLFGSGLAVGRGAHLVGSLADLPYVLARVEQDFIVPENVQALIWDETVPTLVTSAILPRWWTVSRDELHAVALYQRAGEELLAAAMNDDKLRTDVLSILSDRMSPLRLERLAAALHSGTDAPEVVPGDVFYLAAEFQRRFPDSDKWGAAGKEVTGLVRQHPEQLSWERLSQDFGVPHPSLAMTYGRELLANRPLPSLSGYGSRLLAESWDSTNLYWARLADERSYSPFALHRLVPELTHRMVEKIFATDLEDWPALARALRETGEEFRHGRSDAQGQPSAGQQQD